MNDVVQFRKFRGMRELALFAGAGGGILGGKMLGWRTVCAVEIERYPRNILLQRQRDGILDPFPIWDDVRTFDGTSWCGKVDVISGGFPCQDISSAGRGLGIERGERSGLWREYARIIREVRPRYCFVENSPMLTVRGLGTVLGDLAALGYDAAWKVLSAGDCGAPHERARMWIVAKDTNSDGVWQLQPQGTVEEQRRRSRDVREEVADASMSRCERFVDDRQDEGSDVKMLFRKTWSCCGGLQTDWAGWWKAEPGLGRLANGIANRLDCIKADGNAQVPIVAARAFCELIETLEGVGEMRITDGTPHRWGKAAEQRILRSGSAFPSQRSDPTP